MSVCGVIIGTVTGEMWVEGIVAEGIVVEGTVVEGTSVSGERVDGRLEIEAGCCTRESYAC